MPAQSGHSQLKSVTSSYCPSLEGHTAVLHAVNPSPARAGGSWMLLQGPGSPSPGTPVSLHGLASVAQGCALPLGQAAFTAHPGGDRNPRQSLGDGQVMAPIQPFCLHSPCTGQQTWFHIGIYFCPKFPCLCVALLRAVVTGSDASRISCIQDFPF